MSQEEYLQQANDFADQQERYANKVASCAAEEGFEVNINEDYGYSPPSGLSGAQVDQYWDVVDACRAEIVPPYERPSTEEVERHYEFLLAAAECLENEGFEVPEPQSKEAFVNAYASDEPAWGPYGIAQEAGQLAAATEKCPQPGSF